MLRYVVSWRSAVKYLGKLDIRISHVFIRLILPVFFEGLFVVPRTLNLNQKVEHGQYGQIRLVMKKTFKL